MLLSSVNPLTTAINVVTYLAKAENVNVYCVLCKLSRFVLLQADESKNNTIWSNVSKYSLSKHPFCLFIWNVQDTISKFTMEDSTSESPSLCCRIQRRQTHWQIQGVPSSSRSIFFNFLQFLGTNWSNNTLVSPPLESVPPDLPLKLQSNYDMKGC